MPDDDLQEVEATIREWRNGQYGRYAIVDIISQDALTTSALYSGNKIKGATPKIGVPFRCKIEKSPSGWRVSELILHGLPEKLESVTGTVREVLRSKKQAIFVIDTLEEDDRQSTAISMEQKVLWKAHLSDIDIGSLVTVDAVRDSNGYWVNQIYKPTAAEALSGDSSSRVIAVAHQEWPTDRSNKGVSVSFRGEGATVSANCFVSSNLLRASGICSLSKYMFPTVGTRYPTVKESNPILNKWNDILQAGTEEELAQLVIDRLELTVEWNEPTQRWRAARLVRPCSLREPSGEKEIIEWVEGVCITFPEKLKKNNHLEKQFNNPSTTDVYYVNISIDDDRVGRGIVRYILHKNIAEYAGLCPDVSVIINLISNKQYWNVQKIHRSIPNRRSVENQ